MYKLIIFDWDGTLMDSTHKIVNCIQAAAYDAELEKPSSERAMSIIGLGLPQAMRVLFGDLPDSQMSQVIERYSYHFVTGDCTQQALFNGVIEGLGLLKKEGVELAVATGKSRRGLNRVLSELSMHSEFICTRCADETRSKPHPQMLHEICDYTGVREAQALMIGDTSYDMDMAKAAKMHSLGVSYGAHDESVLRACGAEEVLANFSEVVDWLLAGRVHKTY